MTYYPTVIAWLELTVHVLEDVEDGEDLPVIRHQRLTHHVAGHHQVLQDLQGGADHLTVPRVQGIWRAGHRGQRSKGLMLTYRGQRRQTKAV